MWHKNDTNFPQVIYADNLTEAYGTEKCRRIRQHIFTELSPIAGDLAAHYVKTAERSSFEQANHALIDIHNQLRIEDLNLCADHEELLSAAKRFAKKYYLARNRVNTPFDAYQTCCGSLITIKLNGHPLKVITWNRHRTGCARKSLGFRSPVKVYTELLHNMELAKIAIKY